MASFLEDITPFYGTGERNGKGQTNDANAIIEARNKAVKKAQEAVDVYNRFFDK